MAERFVGVDRDTPMLLPADLRDWVPEDDLVHFVLEAVGTLPTGGFVLNERGTGHPQYPPSMMLALLIYCYAKASKPTSPTFSELLGRLLGGLCPAFQ
jgi:transposase